MSTLSDVNILRILRAAEVKIPAKEGVDSVLPQALPPLVRQWTRQTLELQDISTEEKKVQQLNFLVELIRCYPTYLTADSVVVNVSIPSADVVYTNVPSFGSALRWFRCAHIATCEWSRNNPFANP